MRFVAAVFATLLAIALTPPPIREAKLATPGERRVTLYPGGGACNDPAGWYEVDADKVSVTVACADADDQAPAPDPDPAPDQNSQDDNPGKWKI